ncbi:MULTISPECIES: hypothetical protein [Streptomyces]|uniref:hypothetical protein n=1 Tax=Streptomyces TaxID=1883 RepID=UPI0027E4EAF9|nr:MULTISPECIES: hypothetical protein [Streptomyces]
MVGDRRRAFERLREAEVALSRADSRRESIGGYDQAAYQFYVAHVLRDTGPAGLLHRSPEASLRVQLRQERQGRLHANAIMAQRQFAVGHIEEACTTWGTFLDFDGQSFHVTYSHFDAQTADVYGRWGDDLHRPDPGRVVCRQQ